MTITTTTQFVPAVSAVFTHLFLRNAKASCAYYAGIQEGDGQLDYHRDTFTYKWRRYENMAVSTAALTPLSGAESYPLRQGTLLSATDYTATVQKYGQVTALNEEAELVNPSEQTAKIMEILGINCGQTLNRLQRDILEDNSTILRVGGGSTDSTIASAITPDIIRKAVNVIENNIAVTFSPEEVTTSGTNYGSVGLLPSYLSICHVDVAEDIMQFPNFKSVETYANRVELYDGEFGSWNRVRFVRSTEGSIDANAGGSAGSGSLRTTGGVNADIYSTVLFGMDFHAAIGFGTEAVKDIYKAGDDIPPMQIIVKKRGSAGAFDPLDELGTMSWKGWHGGAITNPLWGRSIRSAASALNG